MVAGLTTLKSGFNSGVTHAKEAFDFGKSSATAGINAGKSLATTTFNTGKSLTTAALNTSKDLVTTTFNTSNKIVKTAAHELLGTTAKVIDATDEALKSTVTLVAGFVILDTVLNNSYFDNNSKGTSTYKVLNKLDIKNDFTTDAALVQSLQIPAAIFGTIVLLPLASGALDWLKGNVVRLDAALPR